ncbi:MAG: DNA polymerase III subunit beta [Victivallaceae bacterium]|nr:DNA polymerase III subunit beta [Victivallaceae bacterium]
MKFSVNKDSLLKSLQKVCSIIGTRPLLPVLGNVLFDARAGKLTLCATDLEVRISTAIEAEVEVEGSTTVPARKLLALVSRFVADKVTFDVDENFHAKIRCGTGKFNLLGLSSADFPAGIEFASNKEIKIAQEDFKTMLGAISYAVSIDSSKIVLTGVLLTTSASSMTLVATDGKRLALQEKSPESITGSDGECIIPLKSVTEVKRLLEGDSKLIIRIGDKFCSFETENFNLTSKLIEGNYPNYRQVIPTSFQRVVEIPASLLLAKIEMVSQVLSNSTAYIILSFSENKLSLQASSSEVGEGEDELEVSYAFDPMEVSFNPVYLADPLKVCTADTIRLKLNDSFNPVAMECSEGFLYVIMPIRKTQA